MSYTVRQLARLAGISVRTLHYYDEIALLPPAHVGDNGYRYYDRAALLRLQQILFYRELDFSLAEIKMLLDQPEFDTVAALRRHRQALAARSARLTDLIQTIDRTILHLTGAYMMDDNQLFKGFTPEEEARYTEEARAQYGSEIVDESVRRWGTYSQQQKDAVLAEGRALYTDLVQAMPQGHTSPAVQAIMARWHQHLHYFYEPTVPLLRGLGTLYVDNPAFADMYRAMHSDLPEFLQQAINHYCDGLE